MAGSPLIVRLLILFLFLYIILLLVHSVIARGRKSGGARAGKSTPGEEMVLDPQCDTYVPKSDALERGGHYFCSEECARKFLSR